MAKARQQKPVLLTTPPKIAVIVSPGKARWGSCHTIGANLHRAYELAQRHLPKAAQVDFIEYGDKLGKKDLTRLAKFILDKKFSHLAFIDHWPPAFGLLRGLLTISKGHQLPAVLLHIYGDFTFYSTDMVSTFYLLRGQKCRPICASHRQVSLVRRLLECEHKAIGYVPFPVDCKRFFPSASLRDEERRLQGWKKDDFVVLYTGRISLQKNVTLAIQQFFEHLKKTGAHKSKTKFKFVFCGKYDDLGAPFFGHSPPASEYFFRVRNLMAGIDPELGSVSYLGNFEPDKLNRIYNAADGFLSLSLHHDEDFGMSPAEALATGLPCALSDWGGYSSFATTNISEKKNVWLIPAGADDKGLFFFEPTMKDALSAMIGTRRSAMDRAKAAEAFKTHFSIEAVSQKLVQQIADAPLCSVDGPSNIFIDLAKRAIELKEGRAARLYHSYADPLYRSIYSAYHGVDGL